MRRRGELRLIERAVKQGWPTPADEQERSRQLVLSVLDDPAASNREKAAALRCVAAIIQHDGATDAELAKRFKDAERWHLSRTAATTETTGRP